MAKYKAIFWDNDGTLVRTEPLWFKASKEVLALEDIELTKGFYVDHNLKKNLSLFDLAREKGVSEDRILDLRAKRDVIYSKLLLHEVPIIDGIPETLEKLYGKLHMGVVTSSHKDHFEIIMNSTGLRKYFEFFITSDDVHIEKPHPYAYLLALEKSGFKPEECLVIEDTERGVVAAKKAGITCYAIPTELSKTNDFSMADKVLKSAEAIPALIL